MDMNLRRIGKVALKEGLFQIKMESPYIAGLKALEGFSHVWVIWWADQVDMYRETLVLTKPYKPGPEQVGVFATRSPTRPNPIAVTIVSVANLNLLDGILETYYIDADEGTTVLDIKPYYPCSDRPMTVSVPSWCSDLPESIEASATYDWDSFFNF